MFKILQEKKKKITALAGMYMLQSSVALASSISDAGLGSAADVDWPWTSFFNALAEELTGPLPMALRNRRRGYFHVRRQSRRRYAEVYPAYPCCFNLSFRS